MLQVGLIYGGRYDFNDPKPVPVLTGTDIPSFQTDVVWQTLAGNPNFSVSIDLSGLNLGSNGWSFVWGAGTCANDTAMGAVPIPGTVWLLGSGLLGLALLGRRKLKAKNDIE